MFSFYQILTHVLITVTLPFSPFPKPDWGQKYGDGCAHIATAFGRGVQDRPLRHLRRSSGMLWPRTEGLVSCAVLCRFVSYFIARCHMSHEGECCRLDFVIFCLLSRSANLLQEVLALCSAPTQSRTEVRTNPFSPTAGAAAQWLQLVLSPHRAAIAATHAKWTSAWFAQGAFAKRKWLERDYRTQPEMTQPELFVQSVHSMFETCHPALLETSFGVSQERRRGRCWLARVLSSPSTVWDSILKARTRSMDSRMPWRSWEEG